MSGLESDNHRGRVRDSRPRGHNGGPPPSNRGWGIVNSENSVRARSHNRAGPDKIARPSEYSTIIVEKESPAGGGRSSRVHASSKVPPGNKKGTLCEQDIEERRRREKGRERLDKPPRTHPIATSNRNPHDSRPLHSGTTKPSLHARAPLIATSSRVPENRHSKRELSPVSALTKKTNDLRIVNYSDELATEQRKKEEDRKWEKQQRDDQLGIFTPAQSDYDGPGGAHDLVRVGEDLSGGAIRVPVTRTASNPHHTKSKSAATITPSNYPPIRGPPTASRDSRRMVVASPHDIQSQHSSVPRGAGRLHGAPFHDPSSLHASTSRDSGASRRGPVPLFRESGHGHEGYGKPAAAVAENVIIVDNVGTNTRKTVRHSRRGENLGGFY
ncbi:hypothetical protein DID88_009755 [Monilinia fructigena]|uniref:Uncharacterized protein n=1 Tax=Monilinia fructigena TaxID=38457 RepID=A0A395IQC7_9HELO|nr:hypothetical protein DID88_009755 [Monilinia fructigena]